MVAELCQLHEILIHFPLQLFNLLLVNYHLLLGLLQKRKILIRLRPNMIYMRVLGRFASVQKAQILGVNFIVALVSVFQGLIQRGDLSLEFLSLGSIKSLLLAE